MLARHPLEPLDADEIRAASAILRAAGHLRDRVRVIGLTLHEPTRDDLRRLAAGQALDRAVFAVLLDTSSGETEEVLVSLTEGRVASSRRRRDVQPPIVYGELLPAEQAAREHPGWQAAMRRRGITDFSLCMLDLWPAGNFGTDKPGQRLSRALTWVRAHPGDNGYAHPVEGVVTLIDLNAMAVVAVEDHRFVPVPVESGNYTPDATGPLRADVAPLEICQPSGPGFRVEGHEVRWQKWRFRIGFSRNAFDVGEYGVGLSANSLTLGCDCLGEIRYFDAVVADVAGEAQTIANAVCLHEEDAGVLWKHTDWRLGHGEVRRARRLVVSFIATVGNYEYGFYWSFHQDGSLELTVKMTGIISNGAVEGATVPPWGELVAPGVYAPIHQHFFNVRLDPTIDGPGNSVYEVDTVADAVGPREPARQRVQNPATAPGSRVRGPAHGGRAGRALLADREPLVPQPAGPPGELPAGSGGERAAVR